MSLEIAQKRPLGDSGIMVAPIALGTWAMGGTVESWGPVDDRESIAAIHQAIECGINLIDTAPIYGIGHSEEIVGRAVHGRRDDVIIATKCGLLPPTQKTDLPRRCLRPDSVIHECEASLRRLKTDRIDLLQCHWPDPTVPVSDPIGALESLRQQGKIRAWGVCNFSCEQLSAARAEGPLCCLQPPFSMLSLRAGEDLIPYCQEHGLGVLPYSPLAKGLLTGKFHQNSKPGGIRAKDPEFLGQRFRRNLRVVHELSGIADRYGKTVGQLAINWTVSFPGVTAPIVGAKRPSQVIENVGGIGWSISDDDRARIDSILQMT